MRKGWHSSCAHEPFEENSHRQARPICCLALPGGPKIRHRGHARHLARNAAVDHTQRLAAQGQDAASFGGARSFRRSRRCWRRPPALGWILFIQKAAQERQRGRMQGAGLRSGGETPAKKLARKKATEGQVALRRGGGKSREGPRAGQDYSTLSASSLIDAWRFAD